MVSLGSIVLKPANASTHPHVTRNLGTVTQAVTMGMKLIPVINTNTNVHKVRKQLDGIFRQNKIQQNVACYTNSGLSINNL